MKTIENMKMKFLLNFFLLAFIIVFATYIGYKIYIQTTGLSISDQGATGDAFNGLVTPFIAGISGILVYLAFREQVKANILLSNNTQLDTFSKLLMQIKEQVDELEFIDRAHGADVNEFMKNNYENKDGFYTRKFTGNTCILVFSNHMGRNKTSSISWYQKEFIKKLMLIYEDLVLLHRFIDNTKGNNTKYFYAKLNFFFQVNFEPSFKTIFEKLGSNKDDFYYMTIRNTERVRFILSTYQALEQKLFIKEQNSVELRNRIEADLNIIRGRN